MMKIRYAEAGIVAALLIPIGAAADDDSNPVERIAERSYERSPRTSIETFLFFEDFTESDGASTLIRTGKNVGYHAVLRNLEPGAAYTNWFVTFNEPQNCAVPCSCGVADLFTPAVETGIFFATGGVADAYGRASFAGETNWGEVPGGFDQAPAPFGAEPDAEVHIVVRTHGPARDDPGELEVQLTQFDGNCPDGGCVDEQVSVHRSPFCRSPRGRGR